MTRKSSLCTHPTPKQQIVLEMPGGKKDHSSLIICLNCKQLLNKRHQEPFLPFCLSAHFKLFFPLKEMLKRVVPSRVPWIIVFIHLQELIYPGQGWGSGAYPRNSGHYEYTLEGTPCTHICIPLSHTYRSFRVVNPPMNIFCMVTGTRRTWRKHWDNLQLCTQ